MKYSQKIVLKNGKEAYLRNGAASDGNAVLEVFNLTHAETDYLLSYPDENSFDSEEEGKFLQQKTIILTLMQKHSIFNMLDQTQAKDTP